MAAFYAKAYGMHVQVDQGLHACAASGRQVGFVEGPANRLAYAFFAFSDVAACEQHRTRIASLPRADLGAWPELGAGLSGVQDPDGNCIVFGMATAALEGPATGEVPEASTQHFALRTQQIDRMMAFYETSLGFTVSDRVVDDQGQLKAVFLRTNDLHHALALFSAPVTCFDHQSFETPSWDDLKDWADHMSREHIPIFWGVGRHGPGNDVFFMVKDPDGNLAEISSEIEVCRPGRPVGTWKNEQRTLNLWGSAIMRS